MCHEVYYKGTYCAPEEQNTCTWKSNIECGSISLNARIANMSNKFYGCSMEMSSMEETRGELHPERSLGNEKEGGGYGMSG